MKRADLNPPLGKPGGPCKIVRRIEEEVPNPKTQDSLTDKVEEGKSLSNPEASKIYDLDTEKTKGLVSRLYLGPHSQYRMDLRGVSVRDLKEALMEMGKDYHAARKSGDPKIKKYEAFFSGETLEYTTKKGLKVVLSSYKDGAKLVTTFWKGVPDPPPVESCAIRIARRYLAAQKETATIEVQMRGNEKNDAVYSVLRALKLLKYLGDVGASRSLYLEYQKSPAFSFDGDGADAIDSIRLNGKEVTLSSEERDDFKKLLG